METLTSYEAFKAVIQEPFVMIVAKTHGCNTCKMINAHLHATVKAFDALKKYQIFVDDVDQFRGEQVVFSVPTVLIFSEGKEMLRESKFIDTNKINRLIDMAL